MSAPMSDPSLVATISSTLLDDRVSLASIVLPLYDFLITFDQEVRCIWTRKRTSASILYVIIRYYALFSLVLLPSMAYITDLSGSVRTLHSGCGLAYLTGANRLRSCTSVTRAQFTAEIVQYVAWAAFPALRVLALSGMEWKLAIPIFVLACGPFMVNLGWVYFREAPREVTDTISIVALAATWWYTAQGGTFRTTIRVGRFRQPLTRVMVLHGTIYFLAHLILNALHLILTLLSDFAPLQPISLVTLFTDPLSAMLICRFLLALQSAHMQTTSSDLSNVTLNDNWEHGTGTSFDVGTMRFATIVGPMGGSLEGYSTAESTLRGDDSEMGTIASR
ncbi:hypothetical protein ONZ51_g10449 [Trametes cubensis]|uniref:DUF6533 domain-containing protein n=1 Tax=Trametes cubensis TaxID=1111947 RepID=A0AAD7TJS1_9APHY|nr:hypothetical protein ONZ51_g10449 [Trametes cubensis]